ncbi:SIP domain-containing protein [Deinococcus soli (ex Cha et al. 2016)]|uniref:NADPH-dependent ferric siderophore reductase n=2 Tax=Deinococcus soli (ex Cha et al. 2016) TaxID=1309411 RepID=A0AAE3XBL4_9DEIO|nr:SIP domain-containing protein [Deinococcus soli (ex Cha et al. 2016)]MDR6217979.1 NADPH-dependent ferric siderophore reductase [Deinococcus soli (ex Cha et al. 2016)]MDR6328229.1 NADPH-dependent ferric siderophore reductase [Deinococcus soli (ex Cha et al. 2016)]MDR6751081.1 NADPH-dependent ferric siderophore reductase [Deinococcus soli (ex Cha et al. 2016)]
MPQTAPDLDHITDHVNEDHAPELLQVARAFTDLPTPRAAQVLTLDHTGLTLEVLTGSGPRTARVTFPDPTRPPHVNLRALVADAQTLLNERPDTRTATWTLQAARDLSPSLRRLTFHADPHALRGWQPGDAVRFTIADTTRAYTIRRAHAPTGLVDVDVYLHGDTTGSIWARALLPGATVTVGAPRRETLPEFNGPSLLLGDETALPTIAALLEHWPEGDCPGPRVLVETAGPQDAHAALHDVPLPPGTHLSLVPRSGPSGEALTRAALSLDLHLHAVWGALDAPHALELRRALRGQHALSPTQCRVSGYWTP